MAVHGHLCTFASPRRKPGVDFPRLLRGPIALFKMRQWFAILAVVACVAFTVALEIPLTVRSRSVRRPIGSGGLVLAAAKTTTRDISEQEGNFMVNVSIGTPPQNFRLLVQHDATVTYVLGKDCDTGVCPDHAKYDGLKSSTYNGYPKDPKCCVGTISNSGYAFLATDNVLFGDVTIRGATFAVAVNNTLGTNDKRDSVHFDGVLGLGLFKTNGDIAGPILTTALQQKAVDKTMYTIWLQRQNGGDCEQSKALLPVVGSLTLGDLNRDKCAASTIKWHTLRPAYGDAVIDYQTQVDQVSHGDHVYNLDTKITWTARFAPHYEVVLYAPSTITDDIAKRVGAKVQIDSYNNHFYPIDCKAKTPDDVKIVMDGKEYVIPGKHLIDRFYYPRTCSLNLIASDPSATDKYYSFVIGSPFLREYCQTYDAGNNQIGFSKNTDTNEMDTQKICSGAATVTALSVMVVATLYAVVAL